jgi:hypothetical protein
LKHTKSAAVNISIERSGQNLHPSKLHHYSDSPFGALLVTNDFGIVGGRDTEDDESYRYRIHLKLTSQSGSNENALRFALLQTPGISGRSI